MVPSTAVCLALLAAGFLAHLRPGAGARYAVAAVALATVNVVGGFLVTNRMLEMFGSRRRGKGDPAE